MYDFNVMDVLAVMLAALDLLYTVMTDLRDELYEMLEDDDQE